MIPADAQKRTSWLGDGRWKQGRPKVICGRRGILILDRLCCLELRFIAHRLCRVTSFCELSSLLYFLLFLPHSTSSLLLATIATSISNRVVYRHSRQGTAAAISVSHYSTAWRNQHHQGQQTRAKWLMRYRHRVMWVDQRGTRSAERAMSVVNER